jgi:hypothetical protein
MLATLVGLSMLLALVGGTATLAGCLLVRRLRARHARRHPQQAAAREHTRQARRLAAEWPLLAQTLGLGYRDQWTRQHRFPAAEFEADSQGVAASVAAIAGAGLADYQRAADYLADTWGCVSVRAEQQRPGLIRLRGLHRDPLLAPAPIDLSGTAPASLDSLVVPQFGGVGLLDSVLPTERSAAWEDAGIHPSSAARFWTWSRPAGRSPRSPRRWGSAISRSTPGAAKTASTAAWNLA